MAELFFIHPHFSLTPPLTNDFSLFPVHANPVLPCAYREELE